MEIFKSLSSLLPKREAPRNVSRVFSLGGHRSLTILIVAVLLFVSVGVYFVNAVVLTSHTDDAYLEQAQQKAELTHFNTATLKQAQDFSAKANDTSLPAGRINPFAP